MIRLHLAGDDLDRDHFVPALHKALHGFVMFNQCPELDVRAVDGTALR